MDLTHPTSEVNALSEKPLNEIQKIKDMIKEAFKNGGEPSIRTTPHFYRIGKMLGKGAFGRVNLAMHKLTEKLVAVKSINKQFMSSHEVGEK